VRALYEKGVNGLELVKVVDIDLKTRRPVKTMPKTMLSDDLEIGGQRPRNRYYRGKQSAD